ncbi:amidohydrolase [Quadrisphaera granulorum]|nr:amidohydrolase [Quadrisphaera granulorum]
MSDAAPPPRDDTDSPGRRLSRRSLLVGGGVIGAAAVAGGVAYGVNASRKPQSSAAATAGASTAAIIISNGRVWTGDPTTFAEAVAINASGTIIAVGTEAEVRKLNGPKTQAIDAKGGTVMPGIHDAHQHTMSGGEGLYYPTLENAVLTVGELQQKVQAILDKQGDDRPDNWLVVVDWNPAGLTDAVAHRKYLDALRTTRPIFLRGSDFHNGWANMRALEIAGLTNDTPSPDGGVIVKDADGPTGLLKDAAQWIVGGQAPPLTEAQQREASEDAFAFLAGVGITSIMDAAGPAARANSFAELTDSGVAKQRISVASGVDKAQIDAADETLAEMNAVREQFKDHPRVKVRTAKVFMDGVSEYPAQTAAMLDPYLDADGKPTDRRGELYVSEADFTKIATRLDKEGWQIHTHSIGDHAVRASLDGFEAAQKANGGARNRHTVTHVQFCSEQDVPRFAQNQVIANMQMQWASPFSFTLASLEPYVGPDRHRRMYPLGSIAKTGAQVSGSSDWPVDKLNPWNQVRTAVDRKGTFSETGGALYPEQGISLNDSLLMHTAGSAYQLFQDDITGTIAVGKQADLVVLDRDLFGVPIAEVSGATVNYTLIDGQVVHDISTQSGQRFINKASFASAASAAPVFQNALATVNRHSVCCGGTRHA